ncbi:MAG: hypothetical protein ABUL64_02455 [Singulisphaera sp.]
MSSLNKAFIKAYQKNAAPVEPAKGTPRPHFAPEAKAAKPVAASVAERARNDASPAAGPASVVASARESPAAPAAKVTAYSPTPAPSPPPVIELAQPSQVADAQPIKAEADERAAPPVAEKTSTHFDAAHHSVRAPHANFVDPPQRILTAKAGVAAVTSEPGSGIASSAPDTAGMSPRPVILPITGPSPIWRPVYEVPSFIWPELTEVLLETAALQFRAAATDLAEACRRHRKLVTVTAARRGEGCTVVSLALARALVEQQHRVILVDAHFDAPAVADSLGLAAQAGLDDALRGEKPLTEALVESLEDRLVVLPLRQPLEADWRLSVARLKAPLDELRRHCDVLLIDAGPFGDVGDRRHLLSWAAPCRVDRALVVRDLRVTSDEEATEIERRLHGCGIAQWNFVENFAVA